MKNNYLLDICGLVPQGKIEKMYKIAKSNRYIKYVSENFFKLFYKYLLVYLLEKLSKKLDQNQDHI